MGNTNPKGKGKEKGGKKKNFKKSTTTLHDDKKIIRLLLFGTGEGGKTTMVRQLRLAKGDEAALTGEAIHNRGDICFNVIEGAYYSVRAANFIFGAGTIDPAESYALEKAYNEAFELKKVLGGIKKVNLANEEVVKCIENLYKHPQIQNVLKRRNEFQLHDGWDYQMKRLLEDPRYPKWGGPHWEPDVSDLIHSRIRSTGMTYIDIVYEGVKYKFIDTGGQRFERHKFQNNMGVFEAVMFVASMSEYDQVLFEDDVTNRLKETIDLWEQTVNLDKFKDCWFFLIFNKFDLFKKKYKENGIPLPKKLPDVTYHEPPPLAEDDDAGCYLAKQWFEDLFLSKVKESKKAQVRPYTTTALDQKAVTSTIVKATTFLHGATYAA